MSFWFFLEWLDGVLPQASLAVLYAMVLMTCCAVIREWFSSRKPRSVENHNSTGSNVKTRKFFRELDLMENLRYQGNLGIGNTQSVVLLLKSKVSMNLKRVQQTFSLLLARHSLLTVSIYEHEDPKAKGKGLRSLYNQVRYFKEMKEDAILDFSVKRTTADQWKEKFQRELNKSFNSIQVSNGPLWRVAVLKENFLQEEEIYENAIILTAHTVICDGVSLVKICDQFLQILNSYSEYGTNSSTTLYPVRPATSNLLRHIVTLSTFGKIFVACKAIWKSFLSKATGGVKNQFTTVFPPPKCVDSNFVKRTNVLPLMLSEEMTQKLVIICKDRGCSVYSLMIAVSAVAIATVLQNGKLYVPMNIPFLLEWNIRKNCRPQIDDNELGFFSLHCKTEVSVPATEIGSLAFWDFVIACMKKLNSSISKGDHFQHVKVLSVLNGGRTNNNSHHKDALFRLSSIIQHKITEDKNTVYKFNGLQFASDFDENGPVFSNNIVSLNGKLYWSIAYSTRMVTEKLANTFADNILNIFQKVCT